VKVLHILASSLGGGASHVLDLLLPQSPGIEQKLVVSADGGRIAERLRAQGYEVEEIDMAKGWKWNTLVRLIHIVRKNQPSIVHCHGFRAGLYGRIAAKWVSSHTKTLLTVHGFHFFYYRNPLKKKIFIWLERLMRLLTDHVIAVSQTDWQHLLECKLISSETSQVILNGISPAHVTAFEKDTVRFRLHLSEHKRPIIATVARLHYQKGMSYFLNAIPPILKLFPDACFLVVGDGPEQGKLLQIARNLNILQNVQFLGNRQDVDDILSILDIFVLASLWEGLPLSLLEAMRAGIPIVATDVDGNRDVIEDGISGLLVPPKNGEALAQAVIKILHTPSLTKNLVEKAKTRLQTDFSLENMLQKTQQIYRELQCKIT